MGAFMISDLSVILDMAPAGQRPSFMAAYNVTTALLWLPMPLLAGLLADAAGFHSMFSVALAVMIVGVVPVWHVAWRARRPSTP